MQKINEQQLAETLETLGNVGKEVGKVIVGQHQVIRQLLISIMAGGHCLLEGVPGLAKTLMVSSLADTLALDFKRLQFTPDLMPSDIIGTEILETDHDSGARFFKFQKGPVFTHILLADEINRTPPKTQAALLEAMQERSISYAGKHYELPKPFFVLATQNPVEQAGTYPLPEAQLDRFLMFVRVSYPDQEDEAEILRRTTGTLGASLNEILKSEEILLLQSLVREVAVSEPLLLYITQLVRQSRPVSDSQDVSPSDRSLCPAVQEFVQWGAGPRAGQALVLCAKANALLDGRFAITLDDIHAIARPVLRHRLLLNFQAEAQGKTADCIIGSLLKDVPKPTSPL